MDILIDINKNAGVDLYFKLLTLSTHYLTCYYLPNQFLIL